MVTQDIDPSAYVESSKIVERSLKYCLVLGYLSEHAGLLNQPEPHPAPFGVPHWTCIISLHVD